MRIAVLENQPSLSAYLVEILRTWGLRLCDSMPAPDVARLDPGAAPVVVCPAGSDAPDAVAALIDYARRGGVLIAFLPGAELAAAAGLADHGDKAPPLRLRITDFPCGGLAGEDLPVVGGARAYELDPDDDAEALAYLVSPERFEEDTVAVSARPLGAGRIIAFAFDLARCVLLCRQGDPSRAEIVPPDDGCARPAHFAADIGPRDSGWFPYADLLARFFVELVQASIPAPVPALSHLPGAAPGILLYSGDEDGAEVAWNDEELDYLTSVGARMNLYLVPIGTRSTKADVQRYLTGHDLGPHPNIRPLDGAPVGERLAEFERQIRMFSDMFDLQVRSLRNHCMAWAGYLEPIEIMERLGVGMDANWFSTTYMRARDHSPYTAFGAAMPMRFCTPDGRLINVFQQHTHISDDAKFGPSKDYSYRFSPRQFEVILDRQFADVATRFHTPYGVCIHPSNWVKFSRRQGQALLRQAAERGMPAWSYDQWLAFWEARDAWRFDDVAWNGAELALLARGAAAHPDLRLELPAEHAGRRLARVSMDGEHCECIEATRYRRPVALAPLPPGAKAARVTATYQA